MLRHIYRLLRHCTHFTPHEAVNMFKALTLSGFTEGAIEVRDKMSSVEKELPEGEEKAQLTAALLAIRDLSADTIISAHAATGEKEMQPPS